MSVIADLSAPLLCRVSPQSTVFESSSTDLLSDLNARRARPDHGDTFAFDINSLVWPKAGMVNHTLKVLQALPIRKIPLRRKPRTRGPESRPERPARLTPDRPQARAVVPVRGDDFTVEFAVPFHVDSVFDVSEVFAQLRVVRVVR